MEKEKKAGIARCVLGNKETLAAAVERFEKEKKYSGHIALDVDPA